MAELLKTREEELTTADLASDDIPPKQPEGPKLVKGQEPETLDKAAAVLKPMPLFSESEMGDFRAVEQDTDWFRRRATPDGRRRRPASSCGGAASGGRLRRRAIKLGKAVGKR